MIVSVLCLALESNDADGEVLLAIVSLGLLVLLVNIIFMVSDWVYSRG